MKILSYLITVCILSLPVASIAERKKPPTYKISKLFEIKGTQDHPLDQPSDIVVSKNGTIYAVDGPNFKISAYDQGGRFLFSFGKKGNRGGEFAAPIGIGISSTDDLYIADRGNQMIHIFDSRGRFKGKVDLSAHAVVPIDVAVDPTNKLLYITDNKGHRVVVFNRSGKLVSEWGQRGEQDRDFRYPATIWLHKDKLYIADSLNSRAVVYRTNGRFMRQIGSWGVLPGEFFRPKGVAVADDGKVYIADSFIDVIEVFSEEGQFLHVLGEGRGKIRRFTAPGGIFIKNNKLYVTEMLANKVSVYELK
ncbi:MAG: NHL repeat-containing protein [Proteobacteria bacterium]|nr:NHL repeat-containing protein [Pseudomonadota bacterium]